MRDPRRIKEILNLIENVWTKYPDMRLMQLLLGAIGTTKDHFNTEDTVVLEKFKKRYSEVLKDE